MYHPHIPGQQAKTPLLRLWRAAAPALIFALALVLRLDFVLNTPQVPNFGDQRIYLRTAQLLTAGWQELFPHLLGEPPELSAEDDNYMRAETFPYAFQNITGHNGILPFLLTPAFLGDNPVRAIKIAQAVLFATIPLAVILITRRVSIHELAWLAGLVAAVYPPLIISTGRILQQGVATLFLIWGLTCLLYIHRRWGHWLVVAGYICLTAVGYVVLVFRPLMLLWTVFFPVGKDKQRRRAKWGCLSVLALIVLLWTLLTSGLLMRVMFMSQLTNDVGEDLMKNSIGISRHNILDSVRLNFGAFLDTELWRDDSTWLSGLPPRESLETLFSHDPISFVGGILTNGYRLFLQPYNPFGQSYVLDYSGQLILHNILLVLAILGALVALNQPERTRGKVAWLTLLSATLMMATYAIIHVESRYSSMLTPLQIVLAMIGMQWLFTQATWRTLVSLAGVWVVNLAITVPNLLRFFPAMSPATAHTLDVLLTGTGWIATAAIVVRSQWPPFQTIISLNRYSIQLPLPMLFTLATGLGIAIVVIGGMSWDPTWRRWTAEIMPGDQVRQTVVIDDATPTTDTVPVLLIDMDEPGQEANLIIRVNGTEIKSSSDTLPGWVASFRRDYLYYGETNYDHLYVFYSQVSTEHIANFRRWSFVVLDPALWRNENQFVIELLNEGADSITLLGDYAGERNVFVGPSLSPWDDSRSIFRFWWDKDERRVTVPSDLQGINYVAQRGEGHTEDITWSDDLSSAPGFQTGRYRVYVQWLSIEAIPFLEWFLPET